MPRLKMPIEDHLALALASTRIARDAAERARTSYILGPNDSAWIECVSKLASAVEQLCEVVEELGEERATSERTIIKIEQEFRDTDPDRVAGKFQQLMRKMREEP